MKRRLFLHGGVATLALAAGASLLPMPRKSGQAQAAGEGSFEFTLSDEEWKARLTEDQFAVLRQEATERPFTSPLNDEKREGIFACAGCDLALFSSETKYDSGTGWPSFYAPIEGAIGTRIDYKLFLPRTEVHCARCGGHQGHVFDDGPEPTGLRYCINGVALTFHPASEA